MDLDRNAHWWGVNSYPVPTNTQPLEIDESKLKSTGTSVTDTRIKSADLNM
jgi:hypothetical protein